MINSTQLDLFYIFAFTFGLLIFASITSYILLYLQPKNTTFKKVKTIIKGWWFIASYLMACFVFPPWSLLLGFAVISIFAIREYYRLSRLGPLAPKLAFLLVIFIFLQYGILTQGNWPLFQVFPILFLLLALPLFIVLTSTYSRLAEVISSFVGPVLIFHFLAFAPALYLFGLQTWGQETKALYLVFAVIFLTEANDIMQFLAGKSLGRRKITPEISPNKTEAGFLGGLIGSATLAYLLLPRIIGLPPFVALGLGLLISFFGILGDLLFSSVKRYFGEKDFSNALPGHGGYLDRLDSMILTLPAAYYYLWFIKLMVEPQL